MNKLFFKFFDTTPVAVRFVVKYNIYLNIIVEESDLYIGIISLLCPQDIFVLDL